MAPLTLELAREKAQAIRERLARGEGLQERVIFADLMKDVIEQKMTESKNDKHKAQ
jgi:predicted house-cleaning NTP pyrophosphatase (Maf/HAM1 superfamily)